MRGSFSGEPAEHRADRHADPGDVSLPQDVARHHLAGRIDIPGGVAAAPAFVFLASEELRYITGEVLGVTGEKLLP